MAYRWRRGKVNLRRSAYVSWLSEFPCFSGASPAIVLFLYQLFIHGGILGFAYVFACPIGCPPFSTPSSWILKAVAVFLLMISVALTLYNWVVLVWACTEENIRKRKIFHKDAPKVLLIILRISLVGLIIIILSLFLLFMLDIHASNFRDQLIKFMTGWVSTTIQKSIFHHSFTRAIVIFFRLWFLHLMEFHVQKYLRCML